MAYLCAHGDVTGEDGLYCTWSCPVRGTFYGPGVGSSPHLLWDSVGPRALLFPHLNQWPVTFSGYLAHLGGV